jgi:7,8-dihydropterin-6-yl-methyl-4-(beta-D-ribofuranosyl)aminobenzene 5'-phosphate synthase
MKVIRGLLGLAAVFSLLAVSGHAVAKDRVTILYDAFSDNKAVTKDWGFSALVEHDGKRILFDTGNNPETLEHNVKALSVDLTKLDFVVISHRHSDHAAGLRYLLKVNPTVPIYVPSEASGMFGGRFPAAFFRAAPSLPAKMRYFDGIYPEGLPSGKVFDGGNFILVEKLTEVSPGIYLVATVSNYPGTLELHELALALKTPLGLTIVVGCSHTGIEEILQAASAVDPHVHFLAGGFHLITMPEPEIDRIVDNLKNKWKLEKVAAGHCTGEPAFLRLQKAFGDDYLYAGAGTRIEIP